MSNRVSNNLGFNTNDIYRLIQSNQGAMDKIVTELTGKNSPTRDGNLDMSRLTELQHKLQTKQQIMTMLSNILKSLRDTLSSIIQNFR
jgi:hypothetical protein